MAGTWTRRTKLKLNKIGIPVSGLVYYISPIRNFTQIFNDPIHAIIYVLFVLITCGIFSKGWIEISGSSPKDVARQLKVNYNKLGIRYDLCGSQGLQHAQHSQKVYSHCCHFWRNLYWNFDDYRGSNGRNRIRFLFKINCLYEGTGILLAVSIIYGYFETFKKEKE